MNMAVRVFLALFFLLVDVIFLIVPVTGAFMAYILIMNPEWFRKLLDQPCRPRAPVKD